MKASLIQMLEAAEIGSRELGERVLLHFGWTRSTVGQFYGPLLRLWSSPPGGERQSFDDDDFHRYNPVVSIDGAVALAERVLPEWGLGSIVRAYAVGDDPSPWYAVMCRKGTGGHPPVARKSAVEGLGNTPSLAVVIATLRAHEAQP